MLTVQVTRILVCFHSRPQEGHHATYETASCPDPDGRPALLGNGGGTDTGSEEYSTSHRGRLRGHARCRHGKGARSRGQERHRCPGQGGRAAGEPPGDAERGKIG